MFKNLKIIIVVVNANFNAYFLLSFHFKGECCKLSKYLYAYAEIKFTADFLSMLEKPKFYRAAWNADAV